MIIAIDFDGTCVTHEFPEIGRDLGATTTLKTLVDNGHKLILNTMRGTNTSQGNTLEPAINWFKERGIPLFGINENPTQKRWTNSSKVYASLYIDDANLGIPLIKNSMASDRPYVDWKLVLIDLYNRGCILDENVSACLKDILDAQNDLALFQ